MSPKIVDRDEKRKNIGSAALTHFARNGFHSSSMSSIARSAGVGKGTIYEYFSSKEDLINYSLTLYVQGIEGRVMPLISDIPDPKDRLRQYVHEIIKAIKNDPHTMGVLLAVFSKLASGSKDIKRMDMHRGMFKDARNAICDMIIDGTNTGNFRPETKEHARTIAMNLIAYIDGLWLHSLANPEMLNVDTQVNDYMDRLFDSLETGSSSE